MRHLLAACWLVAPLLLQPHAAQAQTAQAGGKCKFTAPAKWQGYAVKWEGRCEGGQAEGLGVLRAYKKQHATEVFYGRLIAGLPDLGVLETPDGYMAGKFVNGSVAAETDRNTILAAFREAAAAATAASASFGKQGNTASAQHYREAAKRLSAQMD